VSVKASTGKQRGFFTKSLGKLLAAAALQAVVLSNAPEAPGLELFPAGKALSAVRDKAVPNVIPSGHVLSFNKLAGFTKLYLTSYQGALQQVLVAEPRWIEELKAGSDLVEASVVAEPGRSVGVVNGRYYVDDRGRFHYVKVITNGGSIDAVIGFGPLRAQVNRLGTKPSWVALYDGVNRTYAEVFRGGSARGGEGVEAKAIARASARREGAALSGGRGVEIGLTGLGKVRLIKPLELKGSDIILVSLYPLITPKGSFFLFGLCVILGLAVLLLTTVGVFCFSSRGWVPARGRPAEKVKRMGDKKKELDVVGEIDMEIAGVAPRNGVQGPDVEGAKPPVSKGSLPPAEEDGRKAAPSTKARRKKGIVEDIEEGLSGGKKPQGALEKDGIFIKK
jgi:hypothetical protein